MAEQANSALGSAFEEGARRAKNELRDTIDAVPAIVWSTLPDGSVDFLNRRWLEYTGLSLEDAVGGGWETTVHPDDRAEFTARRKVSVDSGQPRDIEIRVRRSDGEYRWWLVRAVPLRDESGDIVKWYGTGLDIEDRKRAEEELSRTIAERARLAAFREDVGTALAHQGELRGILQSCAEAIVRHLDAALARIWIASGDGRELQLQASAGMYTRLDGSHSRFAVGERKIGLIVQERRPHMTNDVQNDPRVSDKEWARREKLASFAGCPLVAEDRVVGVMGMFSKKPLGEATTHNLMVAADGIAQAVERKHAEAALRCSEAYLAEAQRLSRTGSWAWSPDQGIRYWSEECFRVLSFDPQNGLPRFEEFFQRLHPEDQPGFRELIQKAIREKADWEADYRIVHPDGPVLDIHVVGHPVLSASGHLVEFVGTVIDVTERKRAEEDWRRHEMELRHALDLAPQHVAVFGAGRERIYANRILLDYLGITLEEWQQKFERAHFVHPDDRERVNSHFDHALASGAAFELELRLPKSDGSYRWFLFRFNPLHDDKGQIIRWYVAAADIEDRKRAEERLQLENVALREEIDKASMSEEIVGTSTPLRNVLSRVTKVAPTDSTVLITGESGTGKELIARAIHKMSQRLGRAFVSVNCAALAPSLIASELFGHEKGAFTGATQRGLGRFELANGGTIFLDEAGELPPDTQVALLRVLQERELERVGGTHTIKVDVRVIAATNRDLKAATAQGTFRQDLFYRLNVFPIEMPPLRERKDDILLLVEYFVKRYACRAGNDVRSVDEKTLQLLQSYDWPGNIRELQNVIERSVILSSGEVFSVDASWLSRESSQPARHAPDSELLESVPRGEREIIEAALAECRGRVAGPTGAAARLRIPPSTLESRIKALRIRKSQFKFR